MVSVPWLLCTGAVDAQAIPEDIGNSGARNMAEGQETEDQPTVAQTKIRDDSVSGMFHRMK